MKSVKMLNLVSKNLDQILSSGQSCSNWCGLGFNSSVKSISQPNEIKFVPTTVSIKSDLLVQIKAVSSSIKTNNWVCHFYGKKGHIRPFCYALQRYKVHYQRVTYHSLKHKLNSFT